jgi:hypothetical protein
MTRAASKAWLALALGVFAAACSKDVPSAPTENPTVALGRDGQDKGRGDKDREDDGDDDRAVTYAVIGDVPYTDSKLNGGPSFPTLIAAINQDADVSRVIHIGDIKAGSALCTDAYFQDIATQFATFTDPLVYTPGDNEWTDCHRANNGGFNPLDRLAKIRELFFPNPGYTLGARKRIKAQAGYPENQRWEAAGVQFAILHILGSNNGRAPWFGDRAAPNTGETPAETSSREAEYLARNAANIAWMEKTFEEAREERSAGIVLFFQADMWHPEDRAAGAQFTAHQEFVTRLSQLATRFGKPVLLIAGDYHEYRVDAGVPWFATYYNVPAPANVTQIIIDRSIEINRTGAPDPSPIDYLKLVVDRKAPGVFSWTQVNVQ